MATEDSAEVICRRMAELRRDLSGDVREVGRSARAMTDWTFYVRRFPWAMVGLAAGAGYLLVPRKKEIFSPEPAALAELVRNKQLRVETGERKQENQGLMRSLVVMGLTWAAKTGFSYMGEQMRSAALNKAAVDKVPESSFPPSAHPPREETWTK